MSSADFAFRFRKELNFEPTPSQNIFIEKISQFIFSETPLFILRGYAGTGKTTMVSALVKLLPSIRLKSVLLAPTGRAAKVLSSYSGKQAFTVHKKIYRLKKTNSGSTVFVLSENLHTSTIFFVDEASMISDQAGEFGRNSLLEDLMGYIGSGRSCKLILIGDSAQLPPVGIPESPALNRKKLEESFYVQAEEYELTDVVRQEKKSGILHNATVIRTQLSGEKPTFPRLATGKFGDIYQMTGERLEDGLNYAYNKYGMEGTAVICRSNKQANLFNQNIRKRIIFREEEISAGDMVMVVRNNYFWLPENSPAGFIANGDIAEILRVKGTEEMYGHRFATARIRLADYPDEEPLEVKLLLDTLMMDSPSLPQAQYSKLFEAILDDYADEPDRRKRIEKVKADPYYNALQIKFAYAFTCHKTQGGQWEAVFIEQGYLTEEMVDREYLRWLYTAITRARHELFLVNFSSRFFGEPVA